MIINSLRKVGKIAVLSTALALVQNSQVNAGSKLFTGSVADGSSVESIVDYRNENGSQVVFDAINRPESQDDYSLAVRTPRDSGLRLNASVDLNNQSTQFTTFGDFKRGENLTLRSGVFRNTNTGGFAGLKYQGKVTADLDFSHDGEEANLHGYGSLLHGRFYGSLGGDLQQRTISSFQGLVNPQNFGVFNRVKLNLETNIQNGQLILADRSTYKRGTFDYKSGINSNIEMIDVSGDITFPGWAPAPAFATSNYAAVLNWDNSVSSYNLKPRLYYTTNTNFFGFGVNANHSKISEGNTIKLVGEVYTNIPNSPLDTRVDALVDLETGKVDGKVYLGLVRKWK